MATRTARRTKGDGQMSLGAHLKELRRRLIGAAIAIIASSVAGFAFSTNIITALRHPICEVAKVNGTVAALYFTVVTQAFDLRMQIALTVGVVISSPVWLYQIWAFLVPGLVRKEKRSVVAFLGIAIPLFFGGCYAGWAVMPHIVQLMLGFVSPADNAFLDAKYYYDFVLKLLVATGVAFVLPVFLVMLNFVGVISGRAILRGWRVAILSICLFTAIATPAADIISMFLLAVPMVILYFLAVLVAHLHDRRVQRRNAELESSFLN